PRKVANLCTAVDVGLGVYEANESSVYPIYSARLIASCSGLTNAETGSRHGRSLLRVRRAALRGAAEASIFSGAPAHRPTGGWPTRGSRGCGRYRRWRASNRLACTAAPGTARISLFPRQWRFAALAG